MRCLGATIGVLLAFRPALAQAPASAPGETIAIRSAAVPLDGTDPGKSRVGKLEFRGGLHLSSDDPRFGGLSALSVSGDGSRLVAISDQGGWLTARLDYDGRGHLAGVADARTGMLHSPSGRPLEGKEFQDAESMAVLPDGSVMVGFERHHRLWRFPAGGVALDNPPMPQRVPANLYKAPLNGGIEALGSLWDGRLFALTEYWIDKDMVRGWLGGGAGWWEIGYRFEGAYRPSDAGVMANNDLAVLERAYNPNRGIIGIRVAQVRTADLRRGARLKGEVLAELLPPLTMDNFEGLACRANEKGETILYLVSDNNFSDKQRTLLMMFAVVD
jgi:YD repeat-containing protein